MQYKMPQNETEKEKIIGGVLDLNQFFWILGGIALGAIVFAIFFVLTQNYIIGGILCFPFLLTGLPFAFYKKYNFTLWAYLKAKRKMNKKTKILLNRKG